MAIKASIFHNTSNHTHTYAMQLHTGDLKERSVKCHKTCQMRVTCIFVCLSFHFSVLCVYLWGFYCAVNATCAIAVFYISYFYPFRCIMLINLITFTPSVKPMMKDWTGKLLLNSLKLRVLMDRLKKINTLKYILIMIYKYRPLLPSIIVY